MRKHKSTRLRAATHEGENSSSVQVVGDHQDDEEKIEHDHPLSQNNKLMVVQFRDNYFRAFSGSNDNYNDDEDSHLSINKQDESTKASWFQIVKRSVLRQSLWFDQFLKQSSSVEEEYAEEDRNESSCCCCCLSSCFCSIDPKNSEYIHFVFFTLLWNVLLSSFAACICFWIPNYSVWGISISSMMKNAIGCFFIAIITAFQQVKFQYFQTYCMYDAMKNGFLSVFTSFGNYIEDGDILLGMKYGWLKAPINYFATLFLSFICYQVGRLIALRWKAGAKFSWDLLVMENEQHRMAFELSKQDQMEEAQILREQEYRALLQRNNTHKGYGATGASESDSTRAGGVSSGELTARRQVTTHDQKLQKHLHQQMIKRKRHTSKHLQGRHVIIMLLLGLFPLINAALVTIISIYDWRLVPSSVSNHAYKTMWFEFIVSMIWCNVGSLAGRYISGLPLHKQKKRDVQWGTFRANMLSCIFIGTAHNILFLRQAFPYGTSHFFEVIVGRFISDFCGSESSFAGLVDETAVLWNSKEVSRWIPIKNLFYNLFVVCSILLLRCFFVLQTYGQHIKQCTIVFLLVVFSLRVILFNDVRMY